HFRALQDVWFAPMLAYAQSLFAMLAGLEIIVGALLYVSARAGGDYAASLLLRRLMGILTFYAILLNAHGWAHLVPDSFMLAGAGVSGIPALSPWGVMQQGLALAGSFLSHIASVYLLLDPVGVCTGLFCAFGILLCYAVIAAQVCLTLCAGYIVLGGGV